MTRSDAVIVPVLLRQRGFVQTRMSIGLPCGSASDPGVRSGRSRPARKEVAALRKSRQGGGSVRNVQDPAGARGAHDDQWPSLEERLVGGPVSGALGVFGPVDGEKDAARFDPVAHAPSMRVKRRDLNGRMSNTTGPSTHRPRPQSRPLGTVAAHDPYVQRRAISGGVAPTSVRGHAAECLEVCSQIRWSRPVPAPKGEGPLRV